MRVLVTGGREYGNARLVYKVLDQVTKSVDRDAILLIHGGESGTDNWAKTWAQVREVLTAEFAIHPRTAARMGRKGVPFRNRRMLQMNPDLVVAFPGGKETNNCLKQAAQLAIETLIVREKDYE